jgi:hypothetical protein
MQVLTVPSRERPTPTDKHNDLLLCRMSIVDLDPRIVERDYGEPFDKIERLCGICGARASCAGDLKRDRGKLLWEAYCPNSGVLNALNAITKVRGHLSCGQEDASPN